VPETSTAKAVARIIAEHDEATSAASRAFFMMPESQVLVGAGYADHGSFPPASAP